MRNGCSVSYSASRFARSPRGGVVVLVVMVCVSLSAVQLFDPIPRLIWNASASVPVGLYWLTTTKVVARGDLVLAWLPNSARVLAAKRSYLPWNTPAVKRVAGLPGDIVCVRQVIVSIDGKPAEQALRVDKAGRALVPWQGCTVLEPDQVFLLNAASDSFDGRYFGPSERRDVFGTLTPVWTFQGD
ncbi:MAG: S26 family signal peptidase [Micropepsaceae bacterium]